MIDRAYTRAIAHSARIAGLLALAWVAACEEPLGDQVLDASAQGRDGGQADAFVSPDIAGDVLDGRAPDAMQVADTSEVESDGRADVPAPSEVMTAQLDATVERVTDAAEARLFDARPVDAQPVDALPLLDASGGVDGGGAPQVVLRKSYAWANCMPMTGGELEDAVMVTWTVDITGARGDTARVSKGTLTVVGPITIVQTISVDKPTIALVAGAGSAEQRKPLPGTSPNAACTQICGSATKSSYRLEIVVDVDGQSIAVESSGSFVCAY